MAKMDASWKILSFETGGTSIILGFIFAYDKVELLPLVPFLILVTSFLYLGQTESVMNLGSYIRTYIEPDLRNHRMTKNDKSPPYWEEFVQCNRMPYKTLHISTLILFMVLNYSTIILMALQGDRIINAMSLSSDYLLFLDVLVGLFSIFGIIYIVAWYEFIFNPKSNTCNKKKMSRENREVSPFLFYMYLNSLLANTNIAWLQQSGQTEICVLFSKICSGIKPSTLFRTQS